MKNQKLNTWLIRIGVFLVLVFAFSCLLGVMLLFAGFLPPETEAAIVGVAFNNCFIWIVLIVIMLVSGPIGNSIIDKMQRRRVKLAAYSPLISKSCPKCGAGTPQGAKQCNSCGAMLDETEEAGD